MPYTEEIAMFQACSRIIREAGKKSVVMDTASTGHTLLLYANGACHRKLARQMDDKDIHLTTPMMRLQEDLRRAVIKPWAWVIITALPLRIPIPRCCCSGPPMSAAKLIA